jgi:hypothetical protein
MPFATIVLNYYQHSLTGYAMPQSDPKRPESLRTLLTPSTFPNSEDDFFEFKSSQTPFNDLKTKLDRSVSAFANSGGGCFIYGVDSHGNADGGVSPNVGKQSLRDWLDQIITKISPTPSYDIKLYNDCEGRGTLNPGNVIAAVLIFASDSDPRQASDKKYYIRAGAHTIPAGHYIVEALWARRQVQKPVLRHVTRMKPSVREVVQIGVVALTDAPALDVEFTLTPLKGQLQKIKNLFPIKLPVIDRRTPFFVDVAIYSSVNDTLPNDVKVQVTYKDLKGQTYLYESEYPLQQSLPPTILGTESGIQIARSLERLEEVLSKIAQKL